MEMSHKNASVWSSGYICRWLLFCLFAALVLPGKLCGKTSQTYFGDSGVKGSGKVVGLAAEHKGAWVIIDLGITITAEEKKSTFCNS